MEFILRNSVLRPWKLGDESSLEKHANNRKIWINVRDHFPHPYTRADADWWIGHASAQTPPTDFAIVVDGEAAGGIGFILQADVSRRSAEIGYWLGEAFWGRAGFILEGRLRKAVTKSGETIDALMYAVLKEDS